LIDTSSAREFGPPAEQTGVMSVGLDEVPSKLQFSDVLRADPEAPAETEAEEIALWLYTSGTTGLPKAAMHTHKTIGAAGEPLMRSVIGLGPSDRILSASRMFFAYGLGNSVHLPAAVGASVVLNEGPVIPARFNSLLSSTRPTVLCGVPSFFSGLVRLPGIRLPEETRVVLSAGEALSTGLFELFRSTLGLPLLDGLGATEALHHVTCNRPDDVVPGSAGRPLPGFEAKVLDVRGEEPADDEPGELWVKGPTVFAGYWKRPELTARVLQNEWLRTGDRVRIVDRHVFHEGRLDDLIKLGGIWVAPTEIEEVLQGHPDVADAAVVAIDNLDGVPTVKAFVVSERHDDSLVGELKRLSRTRLSRAKVPSAIEQVETLPRTVSGKLRRFVLREGMGSDE
jgi:benzoate-CoA ligase